MFPSIEASEVGTTGLFWLIFSYGYVLFYASNLISEGSDLLMLVPSMAGLVGSVVLPLLGAIPDGAIMLFSGIGDISTAQETLSVGVGALAGSTIMLLTIPWALSIYSGRVNLEEGDDGVVSANYTRKPKLSSTQPIAKTGVVITDVVCDGGKIMMITTIPFFLIQGPALMLHGNGEDVASGEKYYALSGLILCLISFVSYLIYQLRMSKAGENKDKRIAIIKKLLRNGQISLSGALAPEVHTIHTSTMQQSSTSTDKTDGADYGSIGSVVHENIDVVKAYFKEVLRESFLRYDTDGNNVLETNEIKSFFYDLNERITNEETEELINKFDADKNGHICYEEFINACVYFIMEQKVARQNAQIANDSTLETNKNDDDEEEEEEEIPEDFFDMDPDEQQRAIKKRAFTMLAIGTLLVLVFSDPMVDVMQEVASRMGLSPFYVSFVLAPLASNASEVLASQYYAAKKTRKTITVSLSALEGAAVMNNTFCLSIFMGLIYFRGLAWQYTAETMAILLVQFIIGFLVQKNKIMRTTEAIAILSIFPLSIAFVATMEAFGFD